MAPSVRTLRFEQLPDWRRDNPYILTGYRPNLPSMRSCLSSIFGYFHNETVNIHTHLWGSLAFLMLVLSLSSPSEFLPWGLTKYLSGQQVPNSVTWRDTFVFGAFFLSGMSCLGFSALFHTFACHSPKVCSTFGRLDYIGIVWLIVGSFYPSVFYGFYCDRKTIAFYLILITVLGAMATYTVVTPVYRSNDGRRRRTVIFIALGLSAVLPLGHGILSHGLLDSADRIGLWWLVGSGATYIVGAVFYAERFPELLNPGKFDLIGSSHQIFHFLILVAAFMHYVSISKAFNFTHYSPRGYCGFEAP